MLGHVRRSWIQDFSGGETAAEIQPPVPTFASSPLLIDLLFLLLRLLQLLEVVNLSLPKENNAVGATSETTAATQGLVLANDSDTDR